MRIAMTRDDGVAALTRHRARRQVAGTERQRAARTSGKNDQVDVVTDRGEFRHRPGIGPWPGAGSCSPCPARSQARCMSSCANQAFAGM